MPVLLHVLPHPGGGGERVVEMLEGLADYRHRRFALAGGRAALPGALDIVGRRRALRVAVRGADLVHVVGDTSALLMLPQLRRRPTVFGTHGLHLLRRAEGPLLLAVQVGLRAAISRCFRTVCCSQAELAELSDTIPPALQSRLILVPNGVPIAGPADPGTRWEVRQELGLPNDAVVALFLGQLEERKDPLTAILAVKALPRTEGSPAFALLVAGDGPLRAKAAAVADDRIRILGQRDDPDRLLASADLLVLPSTREGLPLSVLEGMAHGLPAVVADSPGNREAVGDAGVVVPAGDVSGFAGALAQLAQGTELRNELAEIAWKRATDRFSIEHFLGRMRAVFASALANGD